MRIPLNNYLKSEPDDGLQQEQREAMLDLMVLAIFVDNHLALVEQNKLTYEAHQFFWDSVTPLEIFLQESTARTRGVLADEKRRESYLGQIENRLADAQTRRKAFSMCRQFIEADGRVAAAESRLLERLKDWQ